MSDQRHKRFLICWAYAGELLLSLLLLVALNLVIGSENVRNWIVKQSAPLGNLLLVGTAATGLTFGGFVAVLTTDFGKELRRAGRATIYVVALAWPLLLFVLTMALLTLATPASGLASIYTYLVPFLLIYSALNFVTMVKNVVGLVGLWQDVDRARFDGKRPGIR